MIFVQLPYSYADKIISDEIRFGILNFSIFRAIWYLMVLYNIWIAILITRRSLVQIQPPQPYVHD